MNNIGADSGRLTIRCAAGRGLLMLGLLLSLTSLSGCKTVQVIPADQVAIRVEAGRAFQPPCSGWFLSDALYQRTRRAVADRILELSK